MGGSLLNLPVMSLRTGTAIGMAVEPAVNPHNLKILGWWCKTPETPALLILLTEDVREVMANGLAVNDEAVFSTKHELVRHQDILDMHFQLIGKLVKTKSQKLGKVADFSYDDGGYFIQKLYVTRPLTKLLAGDTLIIDRAQIVEVTDEFILVEDADVKVTDEEALPAAAPIAPA